MLLCWTPAPPPQGATETDRARHAAEAAAAYRERFSEVAAAGFATASGLNVELVFQAWMRFLSRWMGALKASGHSESNAAQVTTITNYVEDASGQLCCPM